MKLADTVARPVWKRRLCWFGIGTSIALVLFTVIGFLLIPVIARRVGEFQLSQLLQRRVTIEKISVNPYALSLTVQGLHIRDRIGELDLFALRELYLNVELASVFKGGPVIRQVRVVEPSFQIVRTAENRYSFSDLIEKFMAGPPAPPPAPDAKPLRFSVSNIEVIGGRIELLDEWKATRHEITNLNVSVPFVSNFPYLVDTFVQPAFSAVVNGTQLVVDGRSKPFADSLESSIEINLTKVDLPYYLAYVPLSLKTKIRSAVLDTHLKVTFVQFRERVPRVDVSGTIALSKLEVLDDKNRPLLSWPLFEIALDSSDLLSNKLAVRRVLLESPQVHLRRDARGELQWVSLLPAPPKSEATAIKPAVKSPLQKKSEEVATPWQVELGEFKLNKAMIAYSDGSNPRPFQTTLSPLTITVEKFSTVKGSKAGLHMVAALSTGERFNLRGRLGIFPVAFDGTMTIKNISLPSYAPFYESQILFDVRSGMLDLSVPVALAQKGKTLDLAVQGFAAELRQLQLRRRGDRDDFFVLPELSISETNFNLVNREATVGKIRLVGGKVRLGRSGATQSWNVETLLPPVATSAPSPLPRIPSTPVTNENTPDQPFAVRVNDFDLTNWSLRVEDRGPRTTAITNLDRIGLQVGDLSTVRGTSGQINLQARINQTGTMNLTGTFAVAPPKVDVKIKLKTIPIVPMQPYFQDEVALLVTSGHVGVDGRVRFSVTPKGPAVDYQGDVSLADLVTISSKESEELVRLGNLRVSGIDAHTLPLKVNVGEIALTDYAAHVVILPDQTINLASLTGSEKKGDAKVTVQAKPAAPAGTSTAPSPPPVQIGAVVLENGTIQLTDRSIRPFFGASLQNLSGRISGLSFDESTRAKVDIQGQIGNGPLAISGQINPMAKKQYIDLSVKLADMDLSAMTPYSGKYAGYTVEKGQLYLDLKYHIDARQLSAQNNVKIEQFTFGQAVESNDATSLPVRLAVSLLKDRHGVIQLDLPVSGSLDDPKFSIWRVVGMVLKNLLIKAATSPFALLGAAFGKGDELSWLDFDAGESDVPKTAQAKIDALAKSLYERPALRLEVEGHADPNLDLEALRNLELKRRVFAQKVKATVAEGNDAKTTPEVSRAEYPMYLRLAYRADEKIQKLRNAFGMVKDIPQAEMERLILGNIEITQDDLRLLARTRAQKVRERILRAQKIETERIFLIEPKSIAPTTKAKAKLSRVDFRLR
jgi:uncharacterized protein involved in outer membrane biogenesis